MSPLKKYVPGPVRKVLRKAQAGAQNFGLALTPSERTREYCGSTLYYSAGSTIIERLNTEPIFEQEMCEKIVADLQASKNRVFMDVGANLGLIIAYVREKLPDAPVYAFEPGQKQAGLLEKTLCANIPLQGVQLDRRALSNENGTQTFYVHPHRDYAKDGLRDTKRGEKTVATEVQTVTLDSWWEEKGKPHVDVIKMDTEGAELLILRGGDRFLRDVHPVLYLEVEPMNLEAFPYEAKDLVSFLESQGYKVTTLHGEVVTMSNLAEVLATCDTFRSVYDGVIGSRT